MSEVFSSCLSYITIFSKQNILDAFPTSNKTYLTVMNHSTWQTALWLSLLCDMLRIIDLWHSQLILWTIQVKLLCQAFVTTSCLLKIINHCWKGETTLMSLQWWSIWCRSLFFAGIIIGISGDVFVCEVLCSAELEITLMVMSLIDYSPSA